MSYHINMERDTPTHNRKKIADIAMPPLPPEFARSPESVNQEQSPLPQPPLETQQHKAESPSLEPSETPSLEENLSSQEPTEQPEQVQAVEAPKETAQAKNFRELREKAERAQQERDVLAQKLRVYEQQQYQQQPQKQQQAPEEPDFKLSPDDLVEGKHLSKFIKQQKELEARLRQYEAESRLKAKYSDFDKVVTKENIEELVKKNPAFAYSLQQSSANLEYAGQAAYDMIKLLKIDSSSQYDQEKERAQQNSIKPRPLTSVSPQQGDSPMSRANAFANGLTPELQQQLIKEMNAARKAY